MSKVLLNDIQNYLSTVPNDSENQIIYKQKRKLERLHWSITRMHRLVYFGIGFGIVFMLLFSYLSFADKDIVSLIIGLSGLVICVGASILGKKLDTFFGSRSFKRIKKQIDLEI